MRRLLVAGGAAALVTGVCVFVSPWQLTIIAAWSAAAIPFLVAVGRAVLRADAAATLRLSTVEDDSRPVAGLLLVAAATASLTGVGFALARARDVGGMEQAVLTVVALVTIVLSWFVVNSVFMLRYAHLYFSAPVGGVEFPGVEEPGVDGPDYRDFAYLAFTIGMTYQVSDTGLRAPKFRRTVLGHALLSYLFGTVIVATTINIVAGFVR
jgi:uncharacterized membrane protein